MSTDNGTTDPDQVSIADEPEQLTVEEKRALARIVQSPLDRTLSDRPRGGPPNSYPHRLRIVEQLTRPTPLFMSATISKMDGYDANANFVSEALPALDGLYNVLDSVINAREKSKLDPEMVVEATAVLAVAAHADKLTEPALRKVDAAVSVISARLKAAEAELRTGIQSGSGHLTTQAGEVRAFCRGLKTFGERSKFITELIDTNDTESLGAILKGKAYLSGLTAEQSEVFVQQYNLRRRPELPSRIKVMSRVLNQLTTAGSAFTVKLEGAMGVSWKSIQELKAKKAAAKFG